MQRRLIAGLLALVGLTAAPSAAQQSTPTTVELRAITETPGWWKLADRFGLLWDVRLGDGCENAQDGAADLVNDGNGAPLLVLPDDAGTCRIAAMVEAMN